MREEKNPSVEYLKKQIKRNRPMLMAYTINVNGNESGHGISILGYARAKKKSSGNTWNYLKVYNGWGMNPVYLNYTCVDFMYCEVVWFEN